MTNADIISIIIKYFPDVCEPFYSSPHINIQVGEVKARHSDRFSFEIGMIDLGNDLPGFLHELNPTYYSIGPGSNSESICINLEFREQR